MRKRILLSTILLLFISCASEKGEISFSNINYSEDERIEWALSEMTLEEKLAMLHAQSKFSSAGVPRLGIPELWCTDGPHGIRTEVLWDEWDQAGWTSDSCTAYPALTCLAATWDKNLSKLYGQSIGEEARYRKKSVLLGPGVNIARTPLNGRNFEYMGEDPYLASQMVVPYIKAVQENGVAACVKHYALNNQEHNRHTTNVQVSDRALYEIYLPAFKAAVQEGGAWSIMGAYNIYKDEHCCHNSVLLNDILKRDWGFDGVVISDWGGVSDTEEAVKNGLDLEFGTWTDGLSENRSNSYDLYFLANPYLNAIKNGKYTEVELNDKVRRLLRLQLRTNFNRPGYFGRFTGPDHYAAARKIGAEGLVLLKNENILPLKEGKKILVLGENAVKMMTIGGGSSSLKAQHEISPLDGIKARFGAANVSYERAYVGSASNSYNGVSSGQDLSESRSFDKLIDDAIAAAQNVDYVVFIGGLNKDAYQDCEGEDRLDYHLPYRQDEVISRLADKLNNLIVVNVSGNPVAMPWADKVAAIVQDWYLGSEAGNSLADVLSGDVNPSGKLPFTFPVELSDGPFQTEIQYPGVFNTVKRYWEQEYSEDIFVGYRWYEHKGIRPAFEFGYGLSYTQFEYGKPIVSSKISKGLKIRVPISNIGAVDGADVVQLYISDKEASVVRPVKELKGFDKVFVKAGQTAYAEFVINESDLAFYDETSSSWKAEKGDFQALIAASSQDIRHIVEFSL